MSTQLKFSETAMGKWFAGLDDTAAINYILECLATENNNHFWRIVDEHDLKGDPLFVARRVHEILKEEAA